MYNTLIQRCINKSVASRGKPQKTTNIQGKKYWFYAAISVLV